MNRALPIVMFVLLAFISAGAQEVAPDDVIRVKTSLVNSPVLVIGRDGKFVPNLRRDDFEIYENGVKHDIAYFAPVENPFTVAIVIDTSRSALFDLGDIQEAAIAFVDKMRPNDRALVVSFSTDVNVLAEPTSDHEALRAAIRSARPGGNSRVYDAIEFVLTKHLAKIEGRTALILFTDGVDNDSRNTTFEKALQQVARTDTLIYPVQFSTYDYMKAHSPSAKFTPPEGSGFSEQDYQRADVFLHQLASTAGTGVYPAFDISDLERAIASIVDELHNEYSIGYYPRTQGKPGETRTVEVRVNRPQLVVRARSGYVIDQSGVAVRITKKEDTAARASDPTRASDSTSPSDPTRPSGAPGSIPVPRATEAPQTEGRWICSGPEAPTDFAIVKEGFIAHCPPSKISSAQTNAWFIKKPGPGEVLCKGFMLLNGREVAGAPIPTGYVVTGEVKSLVCANSSDASVTTNAWQISVPAPNQVVCKGFPLPRGFVVAGEKSTPDCPAVRGGENAWVIRAKQ
ncbi:MAG: VWA domain-containing protein [Acidobacteria bacterium]|nr:VWA domain-containing protein [Acidobacteriota bacterium]MCA1627589.1 VWA domain-containing protein [Acidobacteriota bacterium]